jgi:hypothetical protein
MQCSNIDWEGGEDDCGDDQKGDRHPEQDPLSAGTAQSARCSSEEQDQRDRRRRAFSLKSVAINFSIAGLTLHLATDNHLTAEAVLLHPIRVNTRRWADTITKARRTPFHLPWVRTREERRGHDEG